MSDGTRTRDIQDHNLVLYQLNYAHHCMRPQNLFGLCISSVDNTSGLNPRLLIRPLLRVEILNDCRDIAGRRPRGRDEGGTTVVLQLLD